MQVYVLFYYLFNNTNRESYKTKKLFENENRSVLKTFYCSNRDEFLLIVQKNVNADARVIDLIEKATHASAM